jgi:hypothetical protein
MKKRLIAVAALAVVAGTGFTAFALESNGPAEKGARPGLVEPINQGGTNNLYRLPDSDAYETGYNFYSSHSDFDDCLTAGEGMLGELPHGAVVDDFNCREISSEEYHLLIRVVNT